MGKGEHRARSTENIAFMDTTESRDMLHAHLLQTCCMPTCLQACCTPTFCWHVARTVVAGMWHARLLQTCCMPTCCRQVACCNMPTCCRHAACPVVADRLHAATCPVVADMLQAQLLQKCCVPSCCRHVASPVKTHFSGPIQGDTHTCSQQQTKPKQIILKFLIFIDLVINW